MDLMCIHNYTTLLSGTVRIARGEGSMKVSLASVRLSVRSVWPLQAAAAGLLLWTGLSSLYASFSTAV